MDSSTAPAAYPTTWNRRSTSPTSVAATDGVVAPEAASSTAKADGATTLPIVMRPPTQIARATTYTYRSAIMPFIIVVWLRA